MKQLDLIRNIRKNKSKVVDDEIKLAELRINQLKKEDLEISSKISVVQKQISEHQAELRRNNDTLLLAEERARHEVDAQKAKEKGIKAVASRFKSEAHNMDLMHKSVTEFLSLHDAVEKRVLEMNGMNPITTTITTTTFSELTPQQLGYTPVDRKTFVFYDPDSLMHRTPAFHCESVQRVVNMIEMLEELNLHPSHAIEVVRDTPPADESLIARAHDEEYIKTIQSSLPVYPVDEPAIFCPGAADKSVELDPENFDTFLTWGSWIAAKRAAGIVCSAIHAVSSGKCKNAFCAIRPPGHHAGRTGETEGVFSQGFCLINNVAIGAMYAVEDLGYKRVAVVDFDVHHGNGTQDILGGRNEFLFISIHVYDEKKYFYPGTGNVNDGPANVLNVPLRRYSGSATYIQAFRNKVVERLKEFRPQLLLISAGFDAHKDDPIRGLKLCTNDFYVITRMLLRVAKRYCNDRVVSVLEGGYDTNPKTNALQISARSHVLALMGQESPEGPVAGGHYTKKRIGSSPMEMEVSPPEIESLSPSSDPDVDMNDNGVVDDDNKEEVEEREGDKDDREDATKSTDVEGGKNDLNDYSNETSQKENGQEAEELSVLRDI